MNQKSETRNRKSELRNYGFSLWLVACGFWFLTSGFWYADAARGFPSVKEIEAALNLYPGARIPQDFLIRGARYHAEYVGAEARRGGQYAIIVKLER